ncbi:hypothetical protein DFH09DRAFT_1310995 [Mycena vulgaris]|nr:hypothetical protein DFH09DRAFT_1310995 [Mycena vulgaris]
MRSSSSGLKLVPPVQRRLTKDECSEIKSCDVFVYYEGESKIKRWTDKPHSWSGSHVRDNSFLYMPGSHASRLMKTTFLLETPEVKQPPHPIGGPNLSGSDTSILRERGGFAGQWVPNEVLDWQPGEGEFANLDDAEMKLVDVIARERESPNCARAASKAQLLNTGGLIESTSSSPSKTTGSGP